MTTPTTTPRPRPILLAQSMLAAVQVVTGAAGFADHVPATAAWWIITGLAAVQIGLAVYLERISTPLSSPQDNRGVPLVPVDSPAAPTGPTAASGMGTTGGPLLPE